MKTIRERAKEFSSNEGKNIVLPKSQVICLRHGYIKGATEQKAIDDDAMHAIVEEQVIKAIEKQEAIDIAKACEWLEGYMESLGYIDEWCRSGEDDFCKAMEE